MSTHLRFDHKHVGDLVYDCFCWLFYNYLFLANNAGYFKAEIAPITIKTKKGDTVFDTDEHPRESTIEDFAKLAPVFQKDGLVTAGTASVNPISLSN